MVWKSSIRYFSSEVLDAEELMQMVLELESSGKKTRILHRSIPMIVDDLESSCTTGFGSITKSNFYLNCLPVLLSYCCNFLEGKHISKLQ